MTREETLAWAKSLKQGDKVIKVTGIIEKHYYVLEVLRVTPSGIVRTTNGESYYQNSWNSAIVGRGYTIGEIIPVTDELLEKANMEEESK